jgi:hypothetical protein
MSSTARIVVGALLIAGSVFAVLASASAQTSPFAFVGYSEYDFGGRKVAFREQGTHRIEMTVKSYIWHSQPGDLAVVKLCHNNVAVGLFAGAASKARSNGRVNKVVIGVGRTTLNC